MKQVALKHSFWYLCLAMWLWAGTTTAQTISGKITDETGQALPGVNILEKGTSNGTSTGIDGTYSIRVSSGNAVLSVSFIGYLNQEISVGNQTAIDFNLALDQEQLKEVVVVGYGTQRKKDLTGAVASVGAKDIQKVPVSGLDQALQGQVAGLQISQSNGAPGGNTNILIRGIGSISGGNEPLFVIDGYPVTNSGIGNPLNTLNPNDIESIDVLKDASATAIYGSRGSNGVIMVTTKRGKAGKTRIEVDAYTGFQQVAKKLELMNSQEFAQYVIDGRNNGYLDNVPTGKITDPNSVRPNSYQIPSILQGDVSKLPTYDWQDAIFRVAPIRNYQVSASGGNENVRYSISGGYFDQQGIVISSGLQRYSFRANLDGNLSKRMKVGISMLPSFTIQDDVEAIGHSSNAVIQAALAISPYIPIYDDQGNYTNTFAPKEGDISYAHALNMAKNLKIDGTQFRFLGNAYLEYEVVKDVKLKTTFGTDLNYSKTRRFEPSSLNPTLSIGQSVARANNAEISNWLSESTLAYKKNIQKHSIDALIGFTAQNATSNTINATAVNFPDLLLDNISGGTVNAGGESFVVHNMLSFLGRVNYVFNGKYLVTATMRRDGSSRFGADNRWGNFPSASVGWRVSEEAFLKKVNAISELKLRASYGLTGNNAIGDYRAIGLISSTNYAIGNVLTPGLSRSSFTNAELGWESMKQLDLGLDLGLFKDRITITVDYYEKTNTDMLFNIQTPSATGLTEAVVNLGEVQNKGVEFGFSSRNLTRAFKWTTNFNITFNKNEVTAMSTDAEKILSTSGGRAAYAITQVGSPIGSFYGRRILGIFQTDEEAKAYGKQPFAKGGDTKWADLNNDGKVDDNDREVIGSPHPDFFFGFNNNFSYKNFSLDILTSGMIGQEIWNQTFSVANSGVQNGLKEIAQERYISPSQPGSGRYGRSIRGSRNGGSAGYAVQDGSFVRIRNVSFAYSFPSQLVNKLKVNALRVYATATNLFTFTNYNGYDPEVSNSGDDLRAAGLDFGTYPQARTYSFGVNLTF